MNYFGDKLRELREKKGLLLRQVAAFIEVDTAFLSKLERGERKAKKLQVLKLAEFLKTDTNDLLTAWLADQIFDVVSSEPVATNAIKIVLNELKKSNKS